MNISDIKQIPISDFLGRLGISPVKTSGAELFYHSPIGAEKTPSFVVNDKKGVWNDFGRDKGGTIIDLGLLIFNTDSVSETIKKFNEIYNGISIDFRASKIPETRHDNNVKIHLIQNIGKNPALSNYLEDRGLLDTISANENIKEVYYDVIKQNGSYKRYFGVGWENQSNGWEISSAYGKICLGKKDITIINGLKLPTHITDYPSAVAQHQKVNVFEGIFDYYSALKMQWIGKDENAIILNSTALVDRAIDYMAKNQLSANLFLDNDRSGNETTDKIKSKIESIDFRYTYSNFNDVNDALLDNKVQAFKR